MLQEAMRKKMEEMQQQQGQLPQTNGKPEEKKADDIQPYRHTTNGKGPKPSSGSGKKKPKKRQ